MSVRYDMPRGLFDEFKSVAEAERVARLSARAS